MRARSVQNLFSSLLVGSLLLGSLATEASARQTKTRYSTARYTPARNTTSPRQRAIDLVKQAADSYNKGQYVAAVNHCKSAAKADLTYARAYVYMGVCYQKMGNFEEAVKAYRWAVALKPSSEDALRARRGLKELGHPPLSY